MLGVAARVGGSRSDSRLRRSSWFFGSVQDATAVAESRVAFRPSPAHNTGAGSSLQCCGRAAGRLARTKALRACRICRHIIVMAVAHSIPGKQFTSRRPRFYALTLLCSLYLAWNFTREHRVFSSLLHVQHNFDAQMAALAQTTVKDARAITVWTSKSLCRGNFVSDHNKAGPREFMIRDVVVDYRHNSLREYRLNNPSRRPFRRIVAYLSVTPLGNGKRIQPIPIQQAPLHSRCPETAPSQHAPKARLIQHGIEIKGFHISVDHILGGPDQPDPCVLVWKDYRDPDEWQIHISIAPLRTDATTDAMNEGDMERVLFDLENRETSVELSLTFRNGSQNFRKFTASFLLGCIPGLTIGTAIPTTDRMFQRRSDSCAQSSGAIIVSGGAMWGGLTSEKGRIQAAHFAARALTGYLRYEAVAIGVTVPRSIAQIQHLCGDGRACSRSFQLENDQFMHDLARDLEKALTNASVSALIWPKIVLFPFCKLGSDFDGTERDIPCSWSRYLGQHHYGYLSYTLFSPFAKWMTSMDIDEAIGDKLAGKGNHTIHSAAVRFDYCGGTEVPGALWLRWYHFKVHVESAAKLTEVIQTHGIPKLRTAQGWKQNDSECYCDKDVTGNGKTTLSCESGMGFRVHRGVLLRNATDLNSLEFTPDRAWDRKNELVTSLLTLHARHRLQFGSCEFSSSR